MEGKRTNIFLSSTQGDTILNDFDDSNCLICIANNFKLGNSIVNCQISGEKKRISIKSSNNLNQYICDNKEKTAKNFALMAELLYHSSKTIVEKFNSLEEKARESARNEIDSFKHNIEHINSEAIYEFYSFIPQDRFVKRYKELQEIVKKSLGKDLNGAVNLITRLVRYNLNIKTELSIISKLNCVGSTPNFSKANPRDAIMTNIYMLYPDFKKRNIFVDVSEYRDWFDIDFEALQVATFYIIENASKYSCENSNFNISFCQEKTTLSIYFKMYSLFIDEDDGYLIFDEGYKGREALQSGKSGKGIGLFRAKRLIKFCKGELILKPGSSKIPEKDGLHYSDNTFIIELPLLPEKDI